MSGLVPRPVQHYGGSGRINQASPSTKKRTARPSAAWSLSALIVNARERLLRKRFGFRRRRAGWRLHRAFCTPEEGGHRPVRACCFTAAPA